MVQHGTAAGQGNPIAGILQDAGASIKPEAIEQLKNDYVAKLTGLWADFMAGKAPELKDRRFAAPAWHASPLSAFNAAAYLLNAEFLSAMADAVEATPHQKQKIAFAVQQIVDAMSPANFLATNPDAQQTLIETKGESLAKGLSNMLSDMGRAAFRSPTNRPSKWAATWPPRRARWCLKTPCSS